MSPDQTQKRDTLLAAARTRPLIMGILNTTPDSFSDGGQFSALEAASAHAAQMIADGADMIDIGGESTRPGATPVSREDEIARVVPLIAQLSAATETPLSIDTYKAETARRAVEAGAVMVNDVWGMTRDPDMASVVADTGAGVTITYNRGEVDETINLVDDARAFFDRSFDQADKAGIPKNHIWLDPGVGFAKTLDQNFEIQRRLDVLLDYGCPVLVGLSRKSFIGLTLDRPVDQRLPGTLTAHIAALYKGASVLRVHDVAAHKDALVLLNQLGLPAHD